MYRWQAYPPPIQETARAAPAMNPVMRL